MKIIRNKTDQSPILEKIKELISDSFFSSKSFFELWEGQNGKGIVWTVEDNNSILAVLPGIEFGLKPFCRFQSMPDGCFGGIIINQNIEFDHNIVINRLLEQIFKYGYLKAYIFDYFKTFPTPDSYKTFNIQTQFIDLRKSNDIPQERKLKSEIKKAQNENVKIVKFDKEIHIDKFITLMKHTEERHKRKPKYTNQFYEMLAERAKDNDKIIWHWCEYEGHSVASHINIIERNHCLNWLAFYDKKFSNLKANQYMQSHLIEILRKRDIHFLNLGASPKDALGLINYKAKWGGESKTYKCLYNKSWLGKWL
jgi:hypothetical protein